MAASRFGHHGMLRCPGRAHFMGRYLEAMAVNLTAVGAGKEAGQRARQLGDQLVAQVGQVILGKPGEIRR